MAKWTMELRTALKTITPNSDLMGWDELAKVSHPYLFNFDYEFYTSESGEKERFEQTFINHYFMREIGFETFELFRERLASHLRKIMPIYTMRWVALSQASEPLSDYYKKETDQTERDLKSSLERDMTHGKTGTVGTKGETTNKLDTQSIDSDNPQVTFAQNDYASAMNRGESNGNTTLENTVTNNLTDTDKGTDTTKDTGTVTRTVDVSGRNRSQASLIEEWNRIVTSLNSELIDSCEDLFLGVW